MALDIPIGFFVHDNMSTTIEDAIRTRFQQLEPLANERLLHAVAASEAKAYGPGGISVVSRITGVSRRAIAQGMGELQEAAQTSKPPARIRKEGGGRRQLVETNPSWLWVVNGMLAVTV